MKHIAVVGGGAAGMMAAAAAARNGAAVDLYEKNEKTGKKIYITGKGRCNLTNACEFEDFFAAVCSNPKFLYSSFYGFTNQDVYAFFEAQGCRLKTERGGRVFPVTDHASDVTAALMRELKHWGVRVHLHTEVRDIVLDELPDGTKKAAGIRLADGTETAADAVIVCTGGLSYRTTGSTGDGMRFAREMGLNVTACRPSLVPMNTAEADVPAMQGLSLKNVVLRIGKGKKPLYEGFGEMMFTHFGITGPLVLTASAVAGRKLMGDPVPAEIDLKSALTHEQLDARLVREFTAAPNKQLGNAAGALLPAKMIPVVIRRSGLSENMKVHDITAAERRQLIQVMKHFSITITGLRDYNEAIITQGGVSVRQLRPDTMEVKNIPGLYFAGEVLDVDAVTGGYNLQIAWSTGYAAGRAAAEQEERI